MIGAVFEVLAAGRTRWRRARNLRAGASAGAGALALAPRRRPHVAPPADSAPRIGLRMPGPPGPLGRLAIGAVLLAGAGAWTIATHARWLGEAAGEGALTDAGLAALQPVLAGAAFDVPAGPGARLETHANAGLLVLSGMRAEPARRIDLCGQMLDPANGRLLPLRIGYRFDEIAALATGSAAAGAAASPPLPLRNVMLADEAMPRIDIRGNAIDGAPLTLRWQGQAEWMGDGGPGAGAPLSAVAGSAALQRQGWLLWGAQDGRRALRVLRRPGAACAQAGELVLQLYRPAGRAASAGWSGPAGWVKPAGPGGPAQAAGSAAPPVEAAAAGRSAPPPRALVAAFPAAGAPVEVRLAPGSYRVPEAAPAELEDRQLFDRLRERGLVRLGAGGLAELAPPDLFAWRALAAHDSQGVGGPAGTTGAARLAGAAGVTGAQGWGQVAPDPETRTLLRHLYQRADGAFVREQLRIFNSERRLLAWRVRAADAAALAGAAWRIDTGGVPAPLAQDMPLAAARLFARLPQGWVSWQRVGAWPAGDTARLRLALAAPARPGDSMRLMLAGRLLALQGARLAGAPAAACDGRACRTPSQVQVLDLQLEPGARELVLDAAPLGMEALAAPGDARYRHVVLDDGRLAWQPLPVASVAPAAATPARLAQVSLQDRNGVPLWHDGAPTGAAADAGLATLLGVRAEQASGVAGMLARLPATWPQAGASAGRHAARLTIDLGLQQAAQAALDCIGMRRGQWDGRACAGGALPAPGRQAGLVLLDAQTGEVLAAAGAGAGKVDDADWREVRDFDRVDPAASALRLPAFQHDGGAERSPGSTFKIVSALGLELAARRDPRLDSLLGGLPLAAINELARRRGFDFRTDAPSYPAAGRARITNFRDQGLDRRAHDGRLGLAQALTYSLNTWFAWTGELSDRSLLGAPAGGVPDLQPLAPGALDELRPIVAMARRLGFGQALRLDGGLLPPDYRWSAWDALQASPAGIDPVHTRHELRQMAIGLRMQATPLQMALVAGAVGQGSVVAPRLLAQLDGRDAPDRPGAPLGVRLDRIRAGMKGVVEAGTAAGAFHGPALERVRRGLFGKTGTAPVGDGDLATVWFTGWLEPHSLPGQPHRLALAVFVSRSDGTGGGHAAPVAAAVLRHLALQPRESGMK